MLNMYQILFKILLFLPIAGILNSKFMNNNAPVQKIINTAIYSCIVFLSFYGVFSLKQYNFYSLNLFTISKNVSAIFTINSFNIIFCFVFSVILFFFNFIFQNYFDYLNLAQKYRLYNVQMSYLSWFYILIIFSQNIIIASFLYILILIYSFFFITNPELKEFRNRYSFIFLISCLTSVILIAMSGFYSLYNNGSVIFAIQNIKKIDSLLSIYWLTTILFLLILVIFCGPIYLIFKEKFYYEDFLPLFVLYVFPFIVFNTLIFFKVLYYIFYNNINNIGLYFYYCGFFMPIIFILACFFSIKYIKNNLKFIILFNVCNFLVFISQLLLVTSEQEIINAFSYFLLFIGSITLNVLAYSGILFLLLKTETILVNNLYKKYKLELNFYMFCLGFPLIINIISFFSLNFHNFNIIYFFNLIELVVLIVIYCIDLIFNYKKIDNPKNNKEPINVKKDILVKFFVPQVAFLAVFLFLFLMREQIFRFIIFYK